MISSREADEVRVALLRTIVNGGLPTVVVVDADHLGHGELLLEHRAEGVGLDPEYARGTLVHLGRLWGKPVTVASLAADGTPVWYRATPGADEVDVLTASPG